MREHCAIPPVLTPNPTQLMPSLCAAAVGSLDRREKVDGVMCTSGWRSGSRCECWRYDALRTETQLGGKARSTGLVTKEASRDALRGHLRGMGCLRGQPRHATRVWPATTAQAPDYPRFPGVGLCFAGTCRDAPRRARVMAVTTRTYPAISSICRRGCRKPSSKPRTRPTTSSWSHSRPT